MVRQIINSDNSLRFFMATLFILLLSSFRIKDRLIIEMLHGKIKT